MVKQTKIDLEPDNEAFDKLACAKHLNQRLQKFLHPSALSCYWYARKNKLRREALPKKWRDELNRRYYARLDELIEAGPY